MKTRIGYNPLILAILTVALGYSLQQVFACTWGDPCDCYQNDCGIFCDDDPPGSEFEIDGQPHIVCRPGPMAVCAPERVFLCNQEIAYDETGTPFPVDGPVGAMVRWGRAFDVYWTNYPIIPHVEYDGRVGCEVVIDSYVCRYGAVFSLDDDVKPLVHNTSMGWRAPYTTEVHCGPPCTMAQYTTDYCDYTIDLDAGMIFSGEFIYDTFHVLPNGEDWNTYFGDVFDLSIVGKASAWDGLNLDVCKVVVSEFEYRKYSIEDDNSPTGYKEIDSVGTKEKLVFYLQKVEDPATGYDLWEVVTQPGTDPLVWPPDPEFVFPGGIGYTVCECCGQDTCPTNCDP